MGQSRRAPVEQPVLDAIAERHSPYGYASDPVGDDELRTLFEAARWAASSYNEQPWRFLVARAGDGDEHERMLSCLVEANQAWARFAPVLALGVASERFARNDRANRHAAHDLGLATAALMLQASALGLQVHAMAGILPDAARDLYEIPDGFDVLTALAIGRPGSDPSLPEAIASRDGRPRERRASTELVFAGSWQSPAGWL